MNIGGRAWSSQWILTYLDQSNKHKHSLSTAMVSNQKNEPFSCRDASNSCPLIVSCVVCFYHHHHVWKLKSHKLLGMNPYLWKHRYLGLLKMYNFCSGVLLKFTMISKLLVVYFYLVGCLYSIFYHRIVHFWTEVQFYLTLPVHPTGLGTPLGQVTVFCG
jgi:hypothetical protein